MAQSPAYRAKASPVSPMEGSRRLSSSPHLFGSKFTPTPNSANRKSSYELSQSADFSSKKQETPSQQHQRAIFEPNLSSSGLPDLNAMMFSSPDLFGYPIMDPAAQQYKSRQSNQLNAPISQTMPGSNPFGNLEGNILGPLPPYLLQGQQPVMGDSGLGQGEQSRDQRINSTGTNELEGQYFGGPDPMVSDFFRDDWGMR